ncbi:hypothetical protein SK128_028522 [Halocaridina rubra]|uniref:Mab-21-like nucleotidyltransferase domain-containing protein n=1 Tax=Halocaridina rubra TaxID=373956 RepID=A0AAN9A3B7_HALRR
MPDDQKIVTEVLRELDTKVVTKVKENAHVVHDFLGKLGDKFNTPNQSREFKFHIMHAGSIYEKLAVEENADFDITLSILDPFCSKNFNIDRDASGYYRLKWKPSVKDQRFADNDGYIQSSRLRKSSFKYLRQCVEKINIPGTKINCYDADSSFSVKMISKSGKISLDLVPQIACSTWGQCKDLKPLKEMPQSTRCYIDTLNKNKAPVMFFSLGIPGSEAYKNPDQLFNVSFSMLEKNYLKENPEIRDMIRLVKYTAKHHDWKKLKDRGDTKMKYPFKSFYAKRVAIKYHNQLKGKNVYEGYKCLLSYMSQELKTGKVDGYFVKDQVMKKWKPEEVSMFRKEVEYLRKLNAKSIFRDQSVFQEKALAVYKTTPGKESKQNQAQLKENRHSRQNASNPEQGKRNEKSNANSGHNKGKRDNQNSQKRSTNATHKASNAPADGKCNTKRGYQNTGSASKSSYTAEGKVTTQPRNSSIRGAGSSMKEFQHTTTKSWNFTASGAGISKQGLQHVTTQPRKSPASGAISFKQGFQQATTQHGKSPASGTGSSKQGFQHATTQPRKSSASGAGSYKQGFQQATTLPRNSASGDGRSKPHPSASRQNQTAPKQSSSKSGSGGFSASAKKACSGSRVTTKQPHKLCSGASARGCRRKS